MPLACDWRTAKSCSAGIVISNADPEVTFGKLVGREHLPNELANKVDRVTYSTSCLSLFFAVDMDLKAAGLDSGNYWFYDHEDVDAHLQTGTDSPYHWRQNRRGRCS